MKKTIQWYRINRIIQILTRVYFLCLLFCLFHFIIYVGGFSFCHSFPTYNLNNADSWITIFFCSLFYVCKLFHHNTILHILGQTFWLIIHFNTETFKYKFLAYFMSCVKLCFFHSFYCSSSSLLPTYVLCALHPYVNFF